ncbi:MAG: TIGR03790 family protein [Vicinamibacterales bacterium]
MGWTTTLFRRSIGWALACAGLMGVAPDASAQSAENVALVINENSPASQQIGDYYIKKRGIPAANVIRLKTETDDEIERQAYAGSIEAPISAALAREGLQDRVLYIVLTKGVPLRISGTSGATGTVSSVDSELAVLYRKMIGVGVPIAGRVDNPYFLGVREVREAKPFTHRDFDIYLVARLDAFTVPEVLALIDKASDPKADGKIVLDQQDKLVDRSGENWLDQAAKRLATAGQTDRVMLDTTIQGVRDVSPVLGYYSWGSNDPRNRVRKYGMGFVPGSIAATYVSTDARTFTEPPAAWQPSGDWTNRRGYFADSPQSLVGDLIREGATGVAGHVAEPFLQSTIRPDILFPAYVSGFNMVESFYLAMPHLSWQTVVIGDPLMTPFPHKTLTRAEIEDAVDTETTLPGLFAKRRVAFATSQVAGMAPRALTLAVRAEAMVVRRDVPAAIAALEEAVEVAPNFSGAQFQLAMLHDQQGNKDMAIRRYRRVVELQPRNAVALNNLAYLIALHEKKPADALPFAQRALTLNPNSPVILDTAGWIRYLLGEHEMALKMLATAVKGAPENAEIHLHVAMASAASGARAAAEFELREALRLNPSLEDSDDVKALRAQLERLPRPN